MIFWLVFLLLINFKVCCIDWGFCHKGLFSLFLKVITNITKLITHNLTFKLLSQYGSKALFVRLHSCINFHNFFFINLSSYLRVVVYKGLMILKRYRKTTFIIILCSSTKSCDIDSVYFKPTLISQNHLWKSL